MLYEMMNKLRRLMEGRYGFDALSGCLLAVYRVLNMVVRTVLRMNPAAVLANAWWTWVVRLLPLALIAWTLFRMFSKNINARCAENGAFVEFWSRLRLRFSRTKRSVSRWATDAPDRKTHKIIACPTCGQQLRVPRGKGKIAITCPKCGPEFVKKS